MCAGYTRPLAGRGSQRRSDRACGRLRHAPAARSAAALLALALLASGLLTAPQAWAKRPGLHGTIRYARLVHACPPPQPGSVSCFAVLRRPVSSPSASVPDVSSPSASSGSSSSSSSSSSSAAGGNAVGESQALPYVAGAGALVYGPAGGLTPALLASAYDYDPVGGAGQTVGIVDAYDDPKIEEDLAEFDRRYGLGECTKAGGCFEKVNQEGSESPKALPAKDRTGWSQEISLDVETVRAVCRQCKILLVETQNREYANMADGVDEAVALGATEVSNSYGGPEQGMEAQQRTAYDHRGVVITAAAGDDGWDDWDYLYAGIELPGMPNAPASLPSVVAVGGTSLLLRENGTRESETVWNDDGLADAEEVPAGYVAGGGCSTLFEADPWQLHAPGFSAAGCGDKRLVADVSADADPLTGFDVYDNYNYCGAGPECELLREELERNHGWLTFGGTSLSSPMIAALYALAGGSGGLPYPALTLYGHLDEAASLYDVTEGGTGFCDGEPASVCGAPNQELGVRVDCEGTTACDAAPGEDGPTGVGTPNGLAAFKPVLPSAVVTPPAALVANVASAFGSGSSSDPYPGATVTAWSWNWGDGTPESHEASPAHTYTASGSYTVSLTVTDSYGLTSAAGKTTVHVMSEAEAEKHRAEEEARAKAREQELAAERIREEEANVKREEEAAMKKREEEAAAKKGQEEKAPLSTGLQQTAAFKALAPAPVPDAQLVGTTLTISPSGTLSLKVSCPAAESMCLGTLTLRTLAPVDAGDAHVARSRAAVLVLAGGPFAVAGGQVTAVKLSLTAKARTLLARSRSLRARASILAHDPAGATHTAQAIITLRMASRRRRKR
jgi:PKD repeat protein